MTSATPPVNRLIIFLIVGFAILMGAIDTTIVSTALHAMEQSLDTSINWAGWTLTAYAFGIMLMLPVTGKLSERFGHRKIFIASVIGFTVASALCGLADNIYMLIFWRVIQAMGGAGFTPAATGIIVDHFGNARDRAVSLFGTIFPMGALIGPIFGGLFVTYWSWRGIFFINLPLGALIVWFAWRHIPHDVRDNQTAEPMDIRGAVLLGCGLLTGMFAINELAEPGGTALRNAALCGVLSVVFMTGFFRHIRRRAAPFIPVRFIYGAGFSAVNLVNAVFGGMTIGLIALLPLYAANRYGMDALSAGALLVAQGVAGIGMSIVCTMMLRKSGYRLPVFVGGCLIIVGMVLLAMPPALGLAPLTWLLGSAFVVGIGTGTMNPASRNAGLQLAPERASIIAALRTLCFNLGIILAVSIATAVLARVPDPGAVHMWVYVLSAVVFIFALRLVRYIPEHHGAW